MYLRWQRGLLGRHVSCFFLLMTWNVMTSSYWTVSNRLLFQCNPKLVLELKNIVLIPMVVYSRQNPTNMVFVKCSGNFVWGYIRICWIYTTPAIHAADASVEKGICIHVIDSIHRSRVMHICVGKFGAKPLSELNAHRGPVTHICVSKQGNHRFR